MVISQEELTWRFVSMEPAESIPNAGNMWVVSAGPGLLAAIVSGLTEHSLNTRRSLSVRDHDGDDYPVIAIRNDVGQVSIFNDSMGADTQQIREVKQSISSYVEEMLPNDLDTYIPIIGGVVHGRTAVYERTNQEFVYGAGKNKGEKVRFNAEFYYE